MEILRASELESRHLGERITVPFERGEGEEAVEVQRGELIKYRPFVGSVMLIIGRGVGQEEITVDVNPDTEVRIDLA